jgi:hypothetical protein
MVHDVFGREKHKLHSENMGGVGSFEKDCRTLYVGRLGRHRDLEDLLWKEFGEWGEVEVSPVIPCSLFTNMYRYCHICFLYLCFYYLCRKSELSKNVK